MNKKARNFFGFAAVGIAAIVATSCGGGGSIGAGGLPGSLGSVSFDIIGTAQDPVTLVTSNGSVTGISGAEFTNVALIDRFTQPVFHASKIDFVQSDLWVMNQTAGLKYQITSTSANELDPNLNRDGSRMVYSSDLGGDTEIWISTPTSQSLAFQLTSNATSDIQPRFSPDGQKIVFSSNRDGNFDIFTMNADGTGVTQITFDGVGVSNLNPHFSPNGTKIAYSSNRTGNNEIWVFNTVGSTNTNHTNNVASDEQPDWSPDGLRIAFASDRTGNFNIFSMAGTFVGGASQLTTDVNADTQPTYSPDGTKIFFTSTRDDTAAPITSEIYSMTTAGASQTRLVTDSSTTQEMPTVATAVQIQLVDAVSPRLGLTACAGFLVGQANTSTTSVLVFDTVGEEMVGRAEAKVVAASQGGVNASNLLFTIQTTVGLSKMSYYNSFGAIGYLPDVTNVVLPNGATNALVSYSGLGATAGQVVSILPYAANRSRLTTKVEGGVTTVKGSFQAMFDAQGKNIAPNGASVVKYNSQTGEIISVK